MSASEPGTEIPNQFELMWPSILALRSLGGSATIGEIAEGVVKSQGFSEEQ